MIKSKLFNVLPQPLKQGLRYAYGAMPPSVRYGRVFQDTYNFLQKSQWWSRERLEEYQMQQLSSLLQHAYEYVPYYRTVFDERGLKPGDIQNFDDMKKLPYLTKDIFKAHIDEMHATNVRLANLHISHTSGTSGKPLQFYEDNIVSQKEFASICHQWSRAGYKPGDARVEMRGAINMANPAYYDAAVKILHLSPRIEDRETVLYYLGKMKSVGAEFLHGYPGTIAAFASMIKKYGFIVPFNLKAVLFASETVYEWEREVAGEVFNCHVFSHYGMAEKAVLAGECEDSHKYHCLPQYGITEIDPDTHEIIATGFLNHITPVIRYRTTDIASMPVSSGCEHCGRHYFPVFEKVEGRLEDFIVTPRGTLIAPAIITHPFKDMKTVKDTQLVQKTPTYIILRATPWDNSDSEAFVSEIEQLCRDLQEILDPGMKIVPEVVKQIERPESGKFRWIESEVLKGLLEKGYGD